MNGGGLIGTLLAVALLVVTARREKLRALARLLASGSMASLRPSQPRTMGRGPKPRQATRAPSRSEASCRSRAQAGKVAASDPVPVAAAELTVAVEIAVAHTSGSEGERVHEPDILCCPLRCGRMRASAHRAPPWRVKNGLVEPNTPHEKGAPGSR